MRRWIVISVLLLCIGFPLSTSASGERMTLGHVVLTLPDDVVATDVGPDEYADFDCADPLNCSVLVWFVPDLLSQSQRDDSDLQVSNVRFANFAWQITLQDEVAAPRSFLDYPSETTDITTKTGVTGVLDKETFRTKTLDIQTTSYTFLTLADNGDARVVMFIYPDSYPRDGRAEFMEMIDNLVVRQ